MKIRKTRKAQPEDMDAIYLMGYDVWGNGQCKDDYLAHCRSSSKYAKGTWFALEDEEGRPVASLVTYALEPVKNRVAIGIGSVATQPDHRRRGYALQLLRDVLVISSSCGEEQVFFLHSDIDHAYYEKVGFVRFPNEYQLKSGSTIMLRCTRELREALWADSAYRPPGYF